MRLIDGIRGTYCAYCVQVVCTGKEQRLLDCFFPENFGDSSAVYNTVDNYNYYDYSSYTANAPTFAPSDAPAFAPNGVQDYVNIDYYNYDYESSAPAPSTGLQETGCARGESRRLSVVCRRFEITGAAPQLMSCQCVPSKCIHGQHATEAGCSINAVVFSHELRVHQIVYSFTLGTPAVFPAQGTVPGETSCARQTSHPPYMIHPTGSPNVCEWSWQRWRAVFAESDLIRR